MHLKRKSQHWSTHRFITFLHKYVQAKLNYCMQHKTFLIHFYHALANVFCTLIKKILVNSQWIFSVLWMHCGIMFTQDSLRRWIIRVSQNATRTLLILLLMKISYIYIQLMCVPQWFVCKHARSIEGRKPCIYIYIYSLLLITFLHLSKIKKVFNIC